MKKRIQQIRLYLAGIAIVVGGSLSWATMAWPGIYETSTDGVAEEQSHAVSTSSEEIAAYYAPERPQITQLAQDYVADGETAYYLYNVGCGQFVTGANSWGTQISLGTEGEPNMELFVEPVDDEDYLDCVKLRINGAFHTSDARTLTDTYLFRDSEAYGFIDHNSQACWYWKFTKADNGTYYWQSAFNEDYGIVMGSFYNAPTQFAAGTGDGAPVVFNSEEESDYSMWAFIPVGSDGFDAFAESLEIYTARQALYEALNMASNEGINFGDFVEIYNNNNTTLQELKDATVRLRSLLSRRLLESELAGASEENPIEATDLILTNADFGEGTINGWQCTFISGQTATNVGYMWASYTNNGYALTGSEANDDGESAYLNQFIEAWSNSTTNDGVVGDGQLSQTVYGLPAGEYCLTCDAIAVDQYNGNNPVTGVQIFISTDTGLEAVQDIATDNGNPEHFSVNFISDGADAVTFGLRTKDARANWIAADNFRVYYLGLSRSFGATYLNYLLNSMPANVTEPCNATLKQAYVALYAQGQEIVDDDTVASETCQEKGDSLKAAYEALEASIAAYATVPLIYQNCIQLIEEVQALGHETLTAELSNFGESFYTGYTDGTLTNEDIENVITDAKTIISQALTANMQIGDDLTLLITNHDFTQQGYGWTHTLSELMVPTIMLDDWTSPQISHSNSTEQSYTFESVEGMSLTFNYRVSSESGCDYLTVYLDGNQIISASGEQSGNYDRALSAGNHTLLLRYSKDGSVNNGSDNGTVSEIKVAVPEANVPTVNYSYGTAEVFHNPFDFYQVIPNMPAGAYRLSCTAFCRMDGRVRSAKLYGGISETRLKLITEESSSYALLGDTQELTADGSVIVSSTGVWPYDSKSTQIPGAEGQTRFVPNSMQGADLYFQTVNPETELPYYTSSVVVVLPEAGDLRIGIKCEGNDEWIIWDNFRLEYAGDHETLMAAAIEDLTPYLAEDVHYNGELRTEATALLASAEAGISEPAEAYRVSASIGNLIDEIKVSMEHYAILSEAIGSIEQKIATTTNLDEEIAAQANELLAVATEAYANGGYENVEADEVAAQLNAYYKRLQSGVLYIDLTKAGELGTMALDLVENFTDVTSIYVTGPMNTDDINNIKRMTALKHLDLSGAQLYSIDNYAFQNNDVLQTVRLPKVLTSLGYRAFYDCDSLLSVTIGGAISSYGGYEFYSCDALEEVVFEEGATTVSSDMFRNCGQLSKVTLPSTLTSIGSSAFYNCYRLTDITLPQNLRTIDSYAFYRDNTYNEYYDSEQGRWVTSDYHSATSLVMPASLTSIGTYAFYNQTDLEQVVLNEGLTSLGERAFYGTKVTSTTLPSTLTSIGYYVFDTAAEVTAMSLVPPTASNNLARNYGTLYVPSAVVKTYKQTSYWSNFNIVGINVMPEQIVVNKALHLELNDSTLADYKANVNILGTSNGYSSSGTPTTLGALEIRNNSTLSAELLTINWNPQQNNYFRYYWGTTYVPQHATLITNGTMRADSIHVRMRLSDGRWNFISLPFDVKVGDILSETPGANWVIRRYDGERRAAADMNNTWVNMGIDDVLEAGKGYIMHCNYNGSSWSNGLYFRFPALNTANKNLIFSSADRTIVLNEYLGEFAHNRSWNLVGNPYAAYMPISAMDFTAPITVWNGTGYSAYSPLDDDYLLTPGEAFFVQRPVDRSTITFSADQRMSWYDATGQSQYNVKAQMPQTSGSRTVFNLILTDGEHADHTRIVLNEKALSAYEVDKDASKFMPMDAMDPVLYSTQNGVDYAINERPLSDGRVQLVARFGQAGSYTISLDTRSAQGVQLEDTETGAVVELNDSEGYTFEANAGVAASRFIVHFDNATAIQSVVAESLTGAEIYTLDGRRIGKATQGVYLIRQNGKVSKVQVK